jgi:preprotein translocase subunit YajC
VSGLIFLVLGLAVIFLLFILPQRRRTQATAAMQSSLRVGDEVVTAGGLYGEVVALADDEIELEIASGTVVRLARRAVAGIVGPEDEEAPEDEEEAAEEAPAVGSDGNEAS